MVRTVFYWPPDTVLAPLLFESGRAKNISTFGECKTDVSGILLGGDQGRLLPEGLGRNEVEFGWAVLRCFIFAVFRKSDSLHGVVCQSKNQKSDAFSGIQLRTGCSPLGKAAKASYRAGCILSEAFLYFSAAIIYSCRRHPLGALLNFSAAIIRACRWNSHRGDCGEKGF